ncbi:MAG: hypothetical protein WCI74_02015 [Actinomycetes bacterium]
MDVNTIFCQWVESDTLWTCSACGAKVEKSVVPKRPIAACRVGAQRNGVPFREIALATADRLRPSRPRFLTHGVGAELKRLLARIGLRPRPGCKCNQRAMLMNQWGPDECERRLEEIVGWLREEAEAVGAIFVDIAARMVVKAAIRKSRRVAAKQP